MTQELTLFFLCVALPAALIAATSEKVEKLLWGAILCSLGLGIAVELSGRGYYGILMISVFLVTDLLIYLFFRSLRIQPRKKIQNITVLRINRVFLLWLGGCLGTGGLYAFYLFFSSSDLLREHHQSLSLLHQKIWDEDGQLILVAILFSVVVAMGGFFLVRRERE